MGTKFEGLRDMFSGPTAIALSIDPVAAAKVAIKFSKQNEKLVVLGGGLGAEQLDIKSVTELAALPSLDELRAKIIGVLNAPASNIAAVLKAPSAQLARVFSAFSETTN